MNRNLKLSYTVLAMQVCKHMEQLFIRDVEVSQATSLPV